MRKGNGRGRAERAGVRGPFFKKNGLPFRSSNIFCTFVGCNLPARGPPPRGCAACAGQARAEASLPETIFAKCQLNL